MKTLNADQLAAFEACARHLHFSAAAAELHISQPALSHRIRKLEDDVGHILFTRNHRQVQLTAAEPGQAEDDGGSYDRRPWTS